MSQAIFIVPSPLFKLAMDWAEAGLVGDSYWLKSDDVKQLVDPNDWQQVRAVKVSQGRITLVVMQPDLANAQGVDRVTVAWVRSLDDEQPPGMAAFRDHLNGFLAHAMRDCVCLLVPSGGPIQPRPTPSDWFDYLVAPSDRQDPDSPDAGWANTSDAVVLQTALALGGCLGGKHPVPNRPNGNDLVVVSAFSRHLRGGSRVVERADELLSQHLPVWCAADLHGELFGEYQEPQNRQKRVFEWIISQKDLNIKQNGIMGERPSFPLAYRRWEPVHPGLTFEEMRFLGADLPEGVPGFSDPTKLCRPVWQRTLHEFLTGRDELEDQKDQPPVLGQPMHPAQYEQVMSAAIGERLNEVAGGNGVLSPPGTWRNMVEALTGVVDGGHLPDGLTFDVAVAKLKLVLPPKYVFSAPETTATVFTEEQAKGFDVLGLAPPAAAVKPAIDEAISELKEEETAGQPTPTGVPFPILCPPKAPKATKALFETFHVFDESAQIEQRKTLIDKRSELSLPEGNQDLPIIDRLVYSVLRDYLRARNDANRWRDLFFADWPEPKWAIGRVRAFTGLGFTLASLAAIFWVVFNEPAKQWLTKQGLGSWPDYLVYGACVAVALASLIAGFLLTMRIIQERDSYWRIRIFSRLGLAALATDAFQRYLQMRNSVQPLLQWWHIFKAVLPVTEVTPVGAPGLPKTPYSLQLADPALVYHYEEALTRQAAGDPGFRKRILDEVLGRAIGLFPELMRGVSVADLYAMFGQPDSPLYRVANVAPQAWLLWRETARPKVVGIIGKAMASGANDVTELIPDRGPLWPVPPVAPVPTVAPAPAVIDSTPVTSDGTDESSGGTDASTDDFATDEFDEYAAQRVAEDGAGAVPSDGATDPVDVASSEADGQSGEPIVVPVALVQPQLGETKKLEEFILELTRNPIPPRVAFAADDLIELRDEHFVWQSQIRDVAFADPPEHQPTEPLCASAGLLVQKIIQIPVHNEPQPLLPTPIPVDPRFT